jgi:tyrosine-protein phosphatase YwqE
VIAHLDRYINKKKYYEKFKKLFQMNLNIQIDLDRYPERHSKKVIDKLIKENHVHIVASDCHDMDLRAPILKEKLELLKTADNTFGVQDGKIAVVKQK